MKKNLLFKTFSGIAALSAFGSLASLTTLTSCNHQAKITINNKITDLDWLDKPYQLDVTFDHQKDAQLLFSSSNLEVATIDDQGCIRGIGNGSTIIKAYSSLDEKVSDEFELNVSELWVSGTVTDQNNNPLENVNVSYDGTSIKTDANGSYRARLAKPGSVLYFDKTNYFGQAFKSTYALASAEHILNVKLTPYVEGASATVKGTVRDVTGKLVPNCSVTFNPENPVLKRHVITDQYGVYTVHLDGINPDDPQVPFVTHNAKYDSLEDLTGMLDTQDVNIQDITVYPFQYDVKAYIGNDHNNEKIIMHAYYINNTEGQQGLRVDLESNFVKAFDDNNRFKLTFTGSGAGDWISNPDKPGHDSYEFDVTFTPDSKTKEMTYGDYWTAPFLDDITIIHSEEDKFHLSVFITDENDAYFGDVEGIHLDSFGRGTFTPYEHAKYNTNPNNELSYVRLDLATNALYPASDNYNIMHLDWDTQTGDGWYVTDVLGNVASKYNFGYQVKLAKWHGTDTTKNGIYVMTKYAQDQMAHYLPDGYQPHFFFYTKELTDGHYPAANDIGTWVKHIAPISGYWMQSFTVNGIQSPFDDRQEYDQIFVNDYGYLSESPKLYCKEDLMITYIPYSFLGDDFDADDTFGFACNLQYQYTGGEWHAWQGNNPTGYVNIPHFEEATSYIQFDNELNIIPYNP